LVAAACGKGKSAADCKAETSKLVTDLETLEQAPPIPFDSRLAFASRPDAAKREMPWAPVINISPDKMVVGYHQTNIEGLVEMLAMEMETSSRKRPPPGTVYVAIDKATPWSRIAPIGPPLLAAGYSHLILLFGVPVANAKPSAIDTELAGKDPAERATFLAQRMTKTIASCRPMQKVFGSVASVEGDQKTPILFQGIREALPACGCSLNMTELRDELVAAVRTAVSIRVLDVTLAPDGAELAFSAGESWGDIATKISAPAPVRFATKP
jgi:hypothetical protein